MVRGGWVRFLITQHTCGHYKSNQSKGGGILVLQREHQCTDTFKRRELIRNEKIPFNALCCLFTITQRGVRDATMQHYDLAQTMCVCVCLLTLYSQQYSSLASTFGKEKARGKKGGCELKANLRACFATGCQWHGCSWL